MSARTGIETVRWSLGSMWFGGLFAGWPVLSLVASVAVGFGADNGLGTTARVLDRLERAQATIAANRSAVASAVFRGRVHAVGKAGTKGVGDLPELLTHPVPFDAKGSFAYYVNRFGTQKRWEMIWDRPPAGAREVLGSTRQILSHQVVLDASDPKRGYLYDIEMATIESTAFDFYRDHWTGGDDILTLIKCAQRGDYCIQIEPDANHSEFEVVRLRIIARVGESEFVQSIQLNSKWDYLPSAWADFGGVTTQTWKWTREPTTLIWYPSRTYRRTVSKYPNGMVWEEEVSVEINSVQINEPIPPETFTFAGLALEPGSPVYDMRSDPYVRYIYEPTESQVEKELVEGLVKPGVAGADQRRSVTRKNLLRTIFITLNILLVTGVGGAFLAYFRKRCRQR